MLGLLVIAHAPLATSLLAVARHTFPDCGVRLAALDVQPDMPIEQTEALGFRLLERVRGPDALIFTDVFGATPCNVALKLAGLVTSGQVKVVAGVNVPMLWRSLCYSHESIDSVLARAVAGAAQGVMQVSSSRPQNQSHKAGGHDQSQHQHQQ